MATLQGHSILFDAPIGDHSIQLGENQLIENINVIYNPRTMRACLQLYMIVLIGQYILSFSSVPFDDVENRPPICIWTSIYSLLMFCACACLLPFASSTIPTITSYRYMLISSSLQFIGLLLSILSSVLALNLNNMYLYDYDSNTGKSLKNDVTIYIQVITCSSLAVNATGFFFSLINSLLASQSLRNLNNKITRKSQSKNETFNEFPRSLSKEVAKSYMA